MLFAYPILDRASYRLSEYFEGAVFDLDEAAGTHVTMIYIGDPAKSGLVHQRLRSARLRKRDIRDSKAYVDGVLRTGREQHHRLREMRILREMFGISVGDVPCIAFLPRSGDRPVGILRLAPSWYDSPASLNAFDVCLRLWLRRASLRRLATADQPGLNVARRLGPLLVDLAAQTDERVRQARAGVLAPKSTEAAGAGAILRICPGTAQAFYKGLEVKVARTPFLLLATLARSPATLVPHGTLVDRASTRAGEFEGSPSRWAKDHKLALMKAFRSLVGHNGLGHNEIEGVLSARNGCLILNLPAEAIAFDA